MSAILNHPIFQKLLFAIRFFTTRRVIDSASALTYSTILSLVPICAVVFSIARGFGYTIYIEHWFRNLLSTQPQAAEFIIEFVNSYLEHTKSGVILGIGLVFMLYTVVTLTRNVEQSFNNIWHVDNRRNIMRTFTDYLAIFFIIPIVLILMSGVTLFITTIASHSEWEYLLEPMAQIIVELIPFLLMWATFVALYYFMPNTKVRFVCTLVPGFLAALAMQVLQLFYVHAQVFISNYNAIYGSFAALPLFMLWIQLSWTICLFGAGLCYTNQNLEDFAFSDGVKQMSHRYRLLFSIIILSKICKRFDSAQRAFNAMELRDNTGIPLSVIRDLLHNLTYVGLVSEVVGSRKENETSYQPAMSIDHITVGLVIDIIESYGSQSFSVELKDLVKNEKAFSQILNIRHSNITQLNNYLLKDL